MPVEKPLWWKDSEYPPGQRSQDEKVVSIRVWRRKNDSIQQEIEND